MAKIAIIGAGGMIFGTTLLNDLFQVEALKGSTIALMDVSEKGLKKISDYTQRLVETNSIDFTVCATTDRREALKGANYVLFIFQIGGIEAYGVDVMIPMKYGVDQCVGECVGPGGVFRALRTIPVMANILQDMEELCPGALVLNYVNPMCANSIGMGRSSSIPFVGLCHGIQTTLDLIASYTDAQKEEIDFLAAGINHMAWFLRIEKDGKDLYPLLRERIEQPEYYIDEKIRGEVMRHFGYFMTESSGHLADYLYWFRKNKNLMDRYCDRPGLGGESTFAYRYKKQTYEFFAGFDIYALEDGKLHPRSNEYCSYVVEALEGGPAFKFNGNVINRGFIENLPAGCCVEVPVYADRMGLHPMSVGALPMQLAALNQSNVSLQMLAAEAALKGDPELVFAAVAMDPLTSTVLSLKETRDMAVEMLEASLQWLPQFEGKKLPKRGHVNVSADTVPHPTPLDPALAVTQRFVKMAEAMQQNQEA